MSSGMEDITKCQTEAEPYGVQPGESGHGATGDSGGAAVSEQSVDGGELAAAADDDLAQLAAVVPGVAKSC
ncbi:hypothetical protein Kisp02_02390 [Kineosporia sp. NBRC 101731]|nr:hypothetical protein Kisp02_02390 [Kineosporia sp. NBRC 101731]